MAPIERLVLLFVDNGFPHMEFAVHTVPAIQLSYNSLYSSRDLLLKSIYNLKCD